MTAHGCVRLHLNPGFRNEREGGGGGARKISRSGRRVVSDGEEKKSNLIDRSHEGKSNGGARQQFYDLGARLKEWWKRRGCIYGERKGCEFHSISRPLTIERVHSSVCTQDISMERSFVEVLWNAEKPAAILCLL